MAGTALPAGQLLIEQMRPRIGADDMEYLEFVVAELEAGRRVEDVRSPINRVLPSHMQPYFMSWFPYDPLTEIAGVTVPILVVHGSTDRLVPPGHAERLAAAGETATLFIVDDMAHTLKAATASRADQDRAKTDPLVPLGDGLVSAVSEFIAAGGD